MVSDENVDFVRIINSNFAMRIKPRPDDTRVPFSSGKRRAVFDKTNGFCWYCGTYLNFSSTRVRSGDVMIVDRIVAPSRGGTNHIDNLVPACRRCSTIVNNSSLEKLRVTLTWLDTQTQPFTEEQCRYVEYLTGVDIRPEPYKFFFEKIRDGDTTVEEETDLMVEIAQLIVTDLMVEIAQLIVDEYSKGRQSSESK